MTDYQVLSELHDLTAEFGRPVVYQQARESQNIVDLKLPTGGRGGGSSAMSGGGERFERPVKVKHKAEKVGTVQVKNGGVGSLGTTADAGTRRAASSLKLHKGKYDPVVVEGTIEFPGATVRVARGGDGIDIFEEVVPTFGRQFGMYYARSWLGSRIQTPAAGAAVAATTWSITDSSGYLIGEQVDIYTTADVFKETVRILDVSLTFDTAMTVTLQDPLVNAVLSTDKIYLSGQGSSTTRLQSQLNAVDSTAAMYTLTTTQFPSGLTKSLPSWDNQSGRRMGDVLARASGERPTDIIANSVGASKIVNASVPQRRFADGKMDPYGGWQPMFDGMPIIVDEQQSDTTLDFINRNKCWVHCFYDFAPDNITGASSGSAGREALILNRQKYTYDLPMSGGFENVWEQRRAFGRFTDVAD